MENVDERAEVIGNAWNYIWFVSQVLVVFLKLLEAIDIPWVYVFIPTYIHIALIAVLLFVLFIGTIFNNKS